MKDIIMLILEPLKEVFSHFQQFFPNVLAMLIIMLAGIISARIIRFALIKLLKAVRFDRWSDRMGLTAVMRKGDLWANPSAAAGNFIFWLLIIAAIMAGLGALQVRAIDGLIAQFVAYIPRVLSAALILVFGYIVAAFISRAVLISAVNRGYHFARLLAEALRLLMILLIVAMALEQLQVAPGIVIAAFSIVFGGIVLAMAIAFGVGGIDAAKRVIEEEAKKKEEGKQDIEHL